MEVSYMYINLIWKSNNIHIFSMWQKKLNKTIKTNAVIKMIMEKNYLKNDMMFILKSEIRLKILTELKDKPQTIRQIVDNTKMAYSSVSNNLNQYDDITSML